MKKSVILGLIFLISALGLSFFRPGGQEQKIETPRVVSVVSKSPSPVVSRLKEDLSLSSIFQYHNHAQTEKEENTYTLIATGDVILARSVNAKMINLHNFKYPFEKTAGFLKNSDIVFINLEAPLIPDCPVTFEGMIFCGDQKDIDGLIYAGVGAASLANNHAGNYGLKGIENTVNLLKKNNIQVTGNGEAAVITVRDKKFGFLGYNDIGTKEKGIALADIEDIKTAVANLKKQVDFAVVAFHWGVEYTGSPNSRQIELAHAAIDSGADLIIGNHPHWVQGIELYKGKFITYAHGNFVFDQMWSRETREGVIGKYVFDSSGLADVRFYPVIIDDYSQPRFATQEEAVKILKRMEKSSAN